MHSIGEDLLLGGGRADQSRQEHENERFGLYQFISFEISRLNNYLAQWYLGLRVFKGVYMGFASELSLFLAAGGAEVERRLVLVLLQLALIIVIARVFAAWFRKMGQPAVVGEIVAGLVLGPSVLGRIETWGWLPRINERRISELLFTPEVTPIMQIIAQLGLVMLLFMIGLEFDFKHLKNRGKAATSISLAGIIAPFGLGIILGQIMFPHIGLPANMKWGFILFMGTAMSITALPILGRMLMEYEVSRTRLAAITITAAAIDDAMGWVLLATVTMIVASMKGGAFDLWHSAYMIGWILLYAFAMLYIVRPLAKRWAQGAVRRGNGGLTYGDMAVMFAVMFLSAIATSKIGIFAIFGGFMFGAILSDELEFHEAVKKSMTQFITVFFLPVFFAFTGLRTDVGSLDSGLMAVFLLGVLAVAIGGKLGGCTIAARTSGFPMRESLCVGIMMNTRALMELVVVNAGYDLGVIPKSVFCMLVIMAIVTTIMTTPILKRCAAGTELEAGMVASGFLKQRGPGFEPVMTASSQA
jgi:Kef-type K+ transport system membrane component KefB